MGGVLFVSYNPIGPETAVRSLKPKGPQSGALLVSLATVVVSLKTFLTVCPKCVCVCAFPLVSHTANPTARKALGTSSWTAMDALIIYSLANRILSGEKRELRGTKCRKRGRIAAAIGVLFGLLCSKIDYTGLDAPFSIYRGHL